jgi:hypothetical protein
MLNVTVIRINTTEKILSKNKFYLKLNDETKTRFELNFDVNKIKLNYLV